MHPTRRDFLKFLGAGSMALTFPGVTLPAIGAQKKPKIGFQLYTVRKAIENDFDGTIQKAAAIGYVGVETYPLPANVTLEHAAKVFKEAGLDVFSMHVELPVGEQRETALRLADAYACDRVVYAGWPEGEKYKDLDAIKKTADTYNEVGAFLRSKGLRFGLHNHWWEFEQHDGFQPFYYLLKNLDKSIFFEIDTYWAKTGGADPAKVVRDFGKRAPLLHIKDGPAIKGEKSYQQVPAGEGVMNFPGIAKAGTGNTEWMIVEFDEYDKDILEGMRKSYAYLTAKGMAIGRRADEKKK